IFNFSFLILHFTLYKTRIFTALCATLLILFTTPQVVFASCAITSSSFGRMPSGEEVPLYTMTNSSRMRVRVMPFGATIVSVETPDRYGHVTTVTQGLDSLENYLKKGGVQGTIVGRYANRIANARFTIDGVEYPLAKNMGAHQIHGGRQGFHRVLWQSEAFCEPFQASDRAGVKMTYLSRDGEEGFPGNLRVTVIYALTSFNDLTMDYEATTDKPTHVNLTNHAYWNLHGTDTGAAAASALDHEITIFADAVLPAGDDRFPTGDPVAVKDTPLDFTLPTAIRAKIANLKGGYDHCYALRKEPGKPMGMMVAARVSDPASGRVMTISTTQIGMQFWSAGASCPTISLETQHYPDSPNHPSYPSTLLRPGETYHQTTIHQFSIRKR
ncbi:MAG: galactose mutarotase, partial [Candidatus Sumerlaeota bacterium]|nr:galactose mutarotase [Candidatus Sumerlaeota bacterium]